MHGWSAARGRYALTAEDQQAAQAQRHFCNETQHNAHGRPSATVQAQLPIPNGLQQRASLRSQPVGGRLAQTSGPGGEMSGGGRLEELQRGQQLTRTGVIPQRLGQGNGAERGARPQSSPQTLASSQGAMQSSDASFNTRVLPQVPKPVSASPVRLPWVLPRSSAVPLLLASSTPHSPHLLHLTTLFFVCRRSFRSGSRCPHRRTRGSHSMDTQDRQARWPSMLRGVRH